MPVEYDHFDPEFADARTHDATRIALLCPTHHREKTSGRLSTRLVADARLEPHNKGKGAIWQATMGPGPVTFTFGGNKLKGNAAGVSINGSPVLRVSMPRSDGVWLLTGNLVSSGKQILKFEDNIIATSSGLWDVELSGTRLTVVCDENDEQHKVAELKFDAGQGEIRIDRLSMSLKEDYSIEVDGTSLSIQQGGTSFIHMENNTFEMIGAGRGPALLIGNADSGVAVQGDTLAFNIPELGTLGDWVRR